MDGIDKEELERIKRLEKLIKDKGYDAHYIETDGLLMVEVQAPDFYESDIDPRCLKDFAWQIENDILDTIPDVEPELMTFTGSFDIETFGQRGEPSYAVIKIFISNLEKFWGKMNNKKKELNKYEKLAELLKRGKYQAESTWIAGTRTVQITSYRGKNFDQGVTDAMAEQILEAIQYQLWKLGQEHLMPKEMWIEARVPLKISLDKPDKDNSATIYIFEMPGRTLGCLDELDLGDE